MDNNNFFLFQDFVFCFQKDVIDIVISFDKAVTAAASLLLINVMVQQAYCFSIKTLLLKGTPTQSDWRL